MIEYILERMNKEPPQALLCTDREYSYYSLLIDGQELLYRIVTLRQYTGTAQRMFRLNDGLARLFGFPCVAYMRERLPSVEWWRRFLTTRSLRRHLGRLKEVF